MQFEGDFTSKIIFQSQKLCLIVVLIIHLHPAAFFQHFSNQISELMIIKYVK